MHLCRYPHKWMYTLTHTNTHTHTFTNTHVYRVFVNLTTAVAFVRTFILALY